MTHARLLYLIQHLHMLVSCAHTNAMAATPSPSCCCSTHQFDTHEAAPCLPFLEISPADIGSFKKEPPVLKSTTCLA